MKLKWSFVIHGNRNQIQNLIHNLNYDDLYFYEEGDEESDLTQYFSSIHLNHLSKPEDIYDSALQLISILNAIDLITQEDKENHTPIILDKMIDIKNEEVIFYQKTPSSGTFSINFNINSSSKPISENYITKIFDLAKSDNFILNLLFIISDGMTFITLYQAFDEIKNFLKNKKDDVYKLGFSKQLISNFTHTSNNFQTLGKKARHGSTGNTPPSIPMKLQDAHKLISDVIRKVIKKYYSIELPIHRDIKIDPNDLW